MYYIVFAIVLILGIQIIKNTGFLRFKYFLIAILTISFLIPIPTSGVTTHRFFTLCYFLSIIYHREFYKIKRFPLIIPLSLIAFSFLLTGINDSRISTINRIWRPFIYFITSYGLLLVGFTSKVSQKDWSKLINLLSNITIIICGYGILTFLFKKDPYHDFVLQGISSAMADFSIGGERTRISSLIGNSHVFAYFCCVLIVLYTYFYLRKALDKKGKIALLLAAISLVVSGNRSSLLAMILSISVLCLISLKAKRFIKTILITAIVLIPIVQMPIVQERIGTISSIFSSDADETEGSSIEMRNIQFANSLIYFEQSPIWGNGFDYYGEVLGKDENVIKNELYGAESYVFFLLIEDGLVQIVCIVLFVILLICYIMKSYKNKKKEKGLLLALFLSFIFVSIVTGNGNKWQFVFPIIGCLLSNYNLVEIGKIKEKRR